MPWFPRLPLATVTIVALQLLAVPPAVQLMPHPLALSPRIGISSSSMASSPTSPPACASWPTVQAVAPAVAAPRRASSACSTQKQPKTKMVSTLRGHSVAGRERKRHARAPGRRHPAARGASVERPPEEPPRRAVESSDSSPSRTSLTAVSALCVLCSDEAADITASKGARKRNAAAAAAAAPSAKKSKASAAAAASSSDEDDSDSDNDNDNAEGGDDLAEELFRAEARSPPSARAAKPASRGRGGGKLGGKLGGRR